MALMYKREVLQNKLNRGEINLETLEKALVNGSKSLKSRESETQEAIMSNNILQDVEMDDTDQETPQKTMPLPQKQPQQMALIQVQGQLSGQNAKKTKPKAGSIFRMRSESPLNNSHQSHSYSPQTAAPNLSLPVSSLPPQQEKSAGQIVRRSNYSMRNMKLASNFSAIEEQK